MAFNGRFVLNLIYFAVEKGANLATLIAVSGLSEHSLEEESTTLEASVYNQIIDRAVQSTRDPHFGLHAGERLNLSAAGLITQIIQSSETVEQALQYCCDFSNLGCSSLPMKLEEEAFCYKLSLTPEPLWFKQSPTVVRHTAEGVLAFSMRAFHTLTRFKHNPVRIHLPWPATDLLISEYERIFACPVHFKQKEIALFFNKRHMEEKIVTANYDLLQVLVQHAEEKSRQLEEKIGFANQVKQTIIRMAQPTFPSIDQVAAHLNLSLRTFQRRLKSEGVNYKDLLQQLRYDFALQYLQKEELSIAEIAYLLDYSDPSSFSRSFKKWTQKTPQVYRSFIQN